MLHNDDPFAFLENSTTRALLGTASATVGPGFLSSALAIAPSAPQLIGEALRRLSIGNSFADAFGAGKRETQQELSEDERRIISQINEPGRSVGALSSIESLAMERQQLTPAIEQAISARRDKLRSNRGGDLSSGQISPEQRLIEAINAESDPQALNQLLSQLRQQGAVTPAVSNAFSRRMQVLVSGR